MQNLRKWGAWLGAGAVLCTLAGCADKDNSGQAETPAAANEVPAAVADNFGDTANAVTGAVGSAGNAVSGAVGATGNAVAGAGNAVAGAASNAATGAANVADGAGSAAVLTPKIKTAIGAAAALKGTTINVDTLADKNQIALRGSVKTAAQKSLAESIAKKNAPGYTIANQLKVGS
jgi:osmotically-inducible protein OsmY